MNNSNKREQSEQIRSTGHENFSSKGKISDEQIIQSARRQRQSVQDRMDVEPWSEHHSKGRGLAAVIAIAASLVSFIAGYGLHANLSQPDTMLTAQNIQVQHDTIMQTTTIRDTVYQTRTVTKYVKQNTAETLTAQAISQPTESDILSASSSDAQMACSMLCDDIPYDLLARP